MEFLKNFFHNAVDTIVENKRQVALALLAALGISAGYMVYRGYRHRCELSAQRALADALKYFDGDVKGKQQREEQDLEARIFDSAQQKWQESAQAFRNAYEHNSSTSIASMFLAYESECYLRLGDLKKAIEILRNALPLITVSQLHQEYSLKLALMLLDASDVEEQEGLKMLEAAAQAKGSLVQDAALYRLGEYYWCKNQFNDAKKYWNQLVTEFADRGEGDKFNSPWAELADPKLHLIESK
jgi:tetratricopeptide (TPR) repeat protein